MDVERAIEHLLDLHAKAEARMDRADARMDRADARMDRFEKQLTATANLVRAGVRMVTGIAKAQRNTDRKLDRLIYSVETKQKRPQVISAPYTSRFFT